MFSPIEIIKDQSLARVRSIAVVIGVGHPLFYVVWTELYPQPYENIWLRIIASVFGVTLLLLSLKFSLRTAVLEGFYGITCFLGTVMVGSWLFVANSANVVWLATYCILVLIYCTLTDIRIAIAGIFFAMVVTGLAMSSLEPEIWFEGSVGVFNGTVGLVVFFTLSVATILNFNSTDVMSTMRLTQRRALGTSAHEIRTPLAGVSLLSDALTDLTNKIKPGRPLSAETVSFIKELSGNISDSVQTTQMVIGTQLANSNPQTAFGRRQTVNVENTARQAIQDFGLGDTSRTGVVLLTVVNDVVVKSDEVVMRQVLTNLLENAMTAVILKSRQPYPGCIEILLESDERLNRIIVKDQGIGIPKSELSKVFQPFYTRHGQNGHGLGLTFVKAAITAYNGTINVTSRLDHGTTVTINIPKQKN